MNIGDIAGDKMCFCAVRAYELEQIFCAFMIAAGEYNVAPLRAKASTLAAPIPDVPPVTSTVLPEKSKTGRLISDMENTWGKSGSNV
jgi:hypothetical protein